MTTRMLIDATHPEETRVVAVSGNRLEDFDYETAQKTQLKGNIYLAKVTRVEPSLQAAFVDYGGNRHGFLAFSEIHPDYYRIPISDREEILQQDAAESQDDDDEDIETDDDEDGASEPEPVETLDEDDADDAAEDASDDESDDDETDASDDAEQDAEQAAVAEADDASADDDGNESDDGKKAGDPRTAAADPRKRRGRGRGNSASRSEGNVDTVGGDEIEDIGERRRRPQRRYRIQEVISRRQIILIQVSKEERGNKGAAITSYISLAGRYCVLMPNTPRGGGISRKIANMQDRKRLKKVLDEFDIPEGMAVIVRTAGAQRTKAEIRRDYEYLVKLWDEIRDKTLESTAPALVHEEANLIKRSIRDLYNKDIDEVLVEGDEGYRTAKDFMKLLMPSHAKRVKQYKEPKIPLFQRYQVEAQIDNIHSPTVQLKSGGYIVLNSTEALVAIDVNSGRATRERNIEETALKTNLEAADEVARQLKLRDLAGLIVIDFIDMEDGRNRHAVERRLKQAMASDRARIQIGRISAFGLLEMSRQRLRPSVIEASTNACPTCGGTGLIRSTESTALTVLRAIEEEGIRQRSEEIAVFVPPQVAFYLLNQKRGDLTAIEGRYEFRVMIEVDEDLIPPDHRIEKISGKAGAPEEEEEAASDENTGKRRRRRGGRKRRGEDNQADDQDGEANAKTEDAADDTDGADAKTDDSEEPKRRRRGRRGGRRRRGGDNESGAENAAENGDDEATDIAADQSADASGSDDDKAEEKPKSNRRRRGGRGRKAEAADNADNVDTASAEPEAGKKVADEKEADEKEVGGPKQEATAEAPETAADSEEEPAKKPARRGRGRSRAKPAKDDKPETDTAQDDAKGKSEPEPAAAAASDKADEAAESKSAESSNGAAKKAKPKASKSDDAAESKSEDAAEGSAPAKPPAKKRRGWWSMARG